MAQTVNTVYTAAFEFRDTSGALVTGKVNGDFTKTAYLSSNGATTAAATVAAVSGQSGHYAVSFTPTAVGLWTFVVSIAHTDGITYRWGQDVDVISAAQADPIAYLIANSVTAVTVVSPTLANGSISGIVRGDDYTAANGTSIPLTLAGKTIPGGASVVYTVYHGPNSVALVKALTITAAGPPAILTLELSRHDTLRLPVGVSQTTIVQTTSGGAVTTLVEGTITVVTVPS